MGGLDTRCRIAHSHLGPARYDGAVYPHRIRLAAPWSREPLEGAGGTRLARRFAWLASRDPHEHVWLTFAGAGIAAEVRLNGFRLGHRSATDGATDYEVTDLLRPRNELVLETGSHDLTAQPQGEVALEVRRSAFLRSVRFGRERVGGAVHAAAHGELVGTAERPLELYFLVAGRTVAYSTLLPEPAGRPFHLIGDATLVDVDPARTALLDLVDGPIVWYRVEGAIQGDPVNTEA